MRQLTYLVTHPTKTETLLREAAKIDPPTHRLIDVGPTGLALAELMQIVLDVPDTRLALDLLAKWQTLAEIAHASTHELLRMEGMTPARLARLRAALELAQRKQKPNERVRVTNPSDIAGWLMPRMLGISQEQFWVVLLDTKLRIVAGYLLYQGNVHSTVIRSAEVFGEAVRANAPNIAIAHSHPSGDPTPSPEDVDVTRVLIDAGRILDIAVIDHIVIGSADRYVSLKQRGLAFGS